MCFCQGDGQDGVTPVVVDRVDANPVFNPSLHGSVRLNGNNVLEQLQRIETLLALLYNVQGGLPIPPRS